MSNDCAVSQELSDGIFSDKSRWSDVKDVCDRSNFSVTSHASSYLNELLFSEGGPANWPVDQYNDGDELGRAVALAVQSQSMVHGWPDGLAMLKRFAKAKSLVAENEEGSSTSVARAIGLADKLDFDSFDALKVYYLCHSTHTTALCNATHTTALCNATLSDSRVCHCVGVLLLQDCGVSALSLMMLTEHGPSRASELSLKKMGLGEVGGCDLFAGIGSGAFPSLKKLILDHNAGLGIRAATRLGAVMADGRLRNLEVLWLNDCAGLKDEGCAQIFCSGALMACPQMKELCVNGVGLGTKGIKSLCEAINGGALENLTTRLNLINNNVDDEGVCSLAAALGSSYAGKRIPRLQLEGCKWGDAGLRALLEEVRNGRLPMLRKLEIQLNKQMKDEGLMAEFAKVAVESGFIELKMGMRTQANFDFKSAFNAAKEQK